MSGQQSYTMLLEPHQFIGGVLVIHISIRSAKKL